MHAFQAILEEKIDGEPTAEAQAHAVSKLLSAGCHLLFCDKSLLSVYFRCQMVWRLMVATSLVLDLYQKLLSKCPTESPGLKISNKFNPLQWIVGWKIQKRAFWRNLQSSISSRVQHDICFEIPKLLQTLQASKGRIEDYINIYIYIHIWGLFNAVELETT